MAEDSDVNEVITEESKASNEMKIDLKDEQNTKAYEETIKIDIGNINKIEKRKKVYTK